MSSRTHSAHSSTRRFYLDLSWIVHCIIGYGVWRMAFDIFFRLFLIPPNWTRAWKWSTVLKSINQTKTTTHYFQVMSNEMWNYRGSSMWNVFSVCRLFATHVVRSTQTEFMIHSRWKVCAHTHARQYTRCQWDIKIAVTKQMSST